MTLRTADTTRKHDLPPLWDDRIVEWRGWQPPIPMFICPPPRAECCSSCGSQAQGSLNAGIVALSAETTQDELDYHNENRRKLGRMAYKRPPLALRRLTAFRCPDCGHDVVHDRHTGEVWDLDASDYGDVGSVDPSTVQSALF